MPVVHTYKHKDGAYVLTRIDRNIVTFQLSKAGEQQLLNVGVVPEKPFARALLFDLYRAGEAFTGGSGAGDPLPESINQLQLDFPDDPDPDTLFPHCDGDDCLSLDDLHLSLVREDGTLSAKLQCPHHRDVTSHLIDSCIPLRLVNLSDFGRLFEIKAVEKKYEGVRRFENLLHLELESQWEELRRRRRSAQQPLFGQQSGELKLSEK